MSDRVKNSVRNFAVGSINRIVWIVFPFIFRTIIIYKIGQEYLGLNNLFSSVLEVFNVADIGLGNAIQSSLYKPIADEDWKSVSSLLKLYRNVYRIIGIVILVLSLCIIPFLPQLIHSEYPSDINIFFLFILFAFNTVAGYLIFPYASIFLNATQRMDLTGTVALISKIITSIMQVIVLLVWKSITLYVCCNLLCTILQNISNYLLVKKRYPQVECCGTVNDESKKKIYNNSIALIFQKIGTTLSLSFDTIIISSFLGLSLVATYGNYNYISSAVGIFLTLSFDAVIASVGNSIVLEDTKKNLRDFYDLWLFNLWVVGWSAICLVCLLQNLEWLWTSGRMMLDNITVVLIAFCFYVTYSRKTVLTYKDALGLWYADKYKPLVGGLFNLVLNILLVKEYGVSGVVISTILSYLFIEIPWENRILFKYYFKKGLKKYYMLYLYMFCVTCISGIITYYICSFISISFSGLIIRFVICFIVPNLLFVLFMFINKEGTYHSFKRIVDTLKSSFLKKNTI